MDILEQMRETADYKLGYTMSSVRTAIMLLETGRRKEALEELKQTVKIIRINAKV